MLLECFELLRLHRLFESSKPESRVSWLDVRERFLFCSDSITARRLPTD